MKGLQVQGGSDVRLCRGSFEQRSFEAMEAFETASASSYPVFHGLAVVRSDSGLVDMNVS